MQSKRKKDRTAKGRTKRGRSSETNLDDSEKYEGAEMGMARGMPKAGKGAEKNEVLRKKKDARMRPSDRAGLLEECGFK